MIETIEGRGVGAGKSYYACMRILAHIAQGGTVYASSTFGLNWEASAKLIYQRWGVVPESDQYHVFDEGDIKRLHEVTPPGTPDMPVLIVIDECHGELNARDWADASKKAFFKWLTQSRHDDNDVIFISQSAHNIDKQIARLVTYISRVRNMRNFSFPGIGKWPLAQFVVNRFDQDGKTLLDRKWFWHDKGIFGCYESKVMRGSHRRINGVGVPKKQLQKKAAAPNNMAKIILVIVLALAAFAWWRFSSKKEVKPPEPPATQIPAAAPQAKGDERPAPPHLRTGRQGVQLREGELLAYDVFPETLRAVSRYEVRTDEGEYRIGRMSKRGLVVAINDEVVRIVQPDGRLGFIVADAKTQAGTAAAKPVATPAPEVPAPSTPAPVIPEGKATQETRAAGPLPPLERKKAARGMPLDTGSVPTL